MVNAKDIDILQILLYTGKPPRKACFFVLPPSIVWIAPKLSRFAEIIGRHAGDAGREALAVPTKELLMRPDICAVIGNENGRVPDDGNALFVGVGLHCLPLLLEDILQENFLFDGRCKLPSPFFQRKSVSPFQSARKGDPGNVVIIFMQLFLGKGKPCTFLAEQVEALRGFFCGTDGEKMLLQRSIEGVIIEPVGIFSLKGSIIRRGFLLLKGLKGFFEQGQLDRRRFFVINPCGRGNGSVLQVRFAQETFFQKQLRADEQGIAGKGGGAGIG